MEWLTFTDATTRLEAARTKLQTIVFVTDLTQFQKDVPIPPRLVPPSEGPPSPTHQWYGILGERWVVVESEVGVDPNEAGRVMVYTPFLENDQTFDWVTLLELRELPASICVMRPLYIESRSTSTDDIVYRPDPKGWNDAIYQAASRPDAETLVEHLKQDEWNRSCFIGQEEPRGEWGILQEEGGGRELILGVYFSLSGSLRTACKLSLQLGEDTILIVRDLSNLYPAERYRVTKGSVIDRPSLTTDR